MGPKPLLFIACYLMWVISALVNLSHEHHLNDERFSTPDLSLLPDTSTRQAFQWVPEAPQIWKDLSESSSFPSGCCFSSPTPSERLGSSLPFIPHLQSDTRSYPFCLWSFPSRLCPSTPVVIMSVQTLILLFWAHLLRVKNASLKG